MLDKKSQAFLWILLLLSIFMVGLFYVILSKPVSMTYNMFYNDSDMTKDQDMQTFFIRSKTIWDFALLPIAIAMILWFIIEIQRRKDMGEYQ